MPYSVFCLFALRGHDVTCSTLAADSVCLLNEVWILLGGWHLVRVLNLSTGSLVVVVATSQNFISKKT